jgi:hypothetical protein
MDAHYHRSFVECLIECGTVARRKIHLAQHSDSPDASGWRNIRIGSNRNEHCPGVELVRARTAGGFDRFPRARERFVLGRSASLRHLIAPNAIELCRERRLLTRHAGKRANRFLAISADIRVTACADGAPEQL